MKNTIKIFSFVLALLLAMSLFGGCGKSNEKTGTSPAPAGSAAPTSSAPSESAEAAPVTYPLTDGATFTCWWPNDLTLSGVQNYNDTPIFKYLEKKTGVHLDFKNPTGQGAAENYNLMLVSGDVTDFVRQVYLYHTRGFDDAIDSGWYLDMMGLKEYCPNLFSRLEGNKELYKQAITDSGYLCGFPMLMSTSADWVNGMMIRQDWLDKYSLKAPVTLADFQKTLETFRDNEKTAAKGPLYMNNVGFTGIEGTFGLTSGFGQPADQGFILRDGAVRACVLEPGYKEYITTMADWYSKKLINPDFVNQAGYISVMDPGRLTGKFGISYDCFVYLDDQNTKGKINFAPLATPVKNEGDKVHTLYSSKLAWPGALCINSKCENIELACHYWDYLYSDEGSTYANFGKEGETMEMGSDGKPHLNDFAAHNPDMNLNQVENYYMLLDGPFYRIGYREYDAISKTELKCGDEWMKGDNTYSLPANLTLTADEGTQKATIMSDLSSFVSENSIKFITGARPISEFDSFIEKVKSMGIDQVVTMYQNALDRYNDRDNLIK